MINGTEQQIREKAAIMELHAIEYLDMFDVPGATINQIKYVKLTFIDGSVFKITPFEFRKLNDVTFMLRPVENDS